MKCFLLLLSLSHIATSIIQYPVTLYTGLSPNYYDFADIDVASGVINFKNITDIVTVSCVGSNDPLWFNDLSSDSQYGYINCTLSYQTTALLCLPSTSANTGTTPASAATTTTTTAAPSTTTCPRLSCPATFTPGSDSIGIAPTYEDCPSGVWGYYCPTGQTLNMYISPTWQVENPTTVECTASGWQWNGANFNMSIYGIECL